MPILANYEEELALFRRLLDPSGDLRILLFQGPSGSGKTTLLTSCIEEVATLEDTFRFSPFQFRGTIVNVAEIFYRVGGHLGWSSLIHFTDEVVRLQPVGSINVEGNRLIGINQRIDVVLRVKDPHERADRLAVMTEAWFKDLSSLAMPLLFVMDSYEEAPTQVQEWIGGPFLARASRLEQMRVLIAGQSVPSINNIEWGTRCVLRELYGVREPSKWLPIVQQMGRAISAADELSWLAGICHAFEGDPSQIMQVIQALPRTRTGTRMVD